MLDREIQNNFHRRADAPRFFNRLDNPWLQTREKALAAKLAALCPQARSVLEVGCGEGSNLYYLKPLLPQAEFTGLDFSEAKIAFAREFLPDLRFERADALALPFPEASFDFVFCRDLLHHVDFDRPGVLREMKRVLKAGGVMAVYEGRGLAPLSLIFQLLYPVERGMRHSSPASLRALGERFGRVELDFVAATSLSPALGFVLGWPTCPPPPTHTRIARMSRNAAYGTVTALEKLLTAITPRTLWVYMLMSIWSE
jgi:SAM-dependent methyltransferase